MMIKDIHEIFSKISLIKLVPTSSPATSPASSKGTIALLYVLGKPIGKSGNSKFESQNSLKVVLGFFGIFGIVNSSYVLLYKLRKLIYCIFYLVLRKENNFDKDLYMTLIKSELKSLILRFAKGPEKNSKSLDFDYNISDEGNPSTSIAKNLSNAIKECKRTMKS